MNTIVEIDWEGVYSDDGALAEWETLKTELDPEDPVFVSYRNPVYSVKVLFSRRPTYPEERVLCRMVLTKQGKTKVINDTAANHLSGETLTWERFPSLRVWREQAISINNLGRPKICGAPAYSGVEDDKHE